MQQLAVFTALSITVKKTASAATMDRLWHSTVSAKQSSLVPVIKIIDLKKPKNLALLLVSFFVISFVALAYPASKIRLAANYAELFSAENEANDYRRFHRQVFGADDTLFIAIVEPDNLDYHFLQQLGAVSLALSAIPEFIRVDSVTHTPVVQGSDDAISIAPLLDSHQLLDAQSPEQDIAAVIARMRDNSLLRNRYISASHDSFIISAELPASFDNSDTVTPLAQQFRQTVLDGFDNTTTQIQFAGIAYTRIGLMELMKHDLSLLLPLYLLLVGVFLYALYRHWVPVVTTYALMVYTVVTMLGIMQLAGVELNQLTMIFPLVAMVVIIANVLHFLQHYYHVAAAAHSDPLVPLLDTIKSISLASFLSCVTTSIGFFSLLVSDMPILREFGWVLGGSLLVCAFSLTLLQPSMLLLLAKGSSNRKVHHFFAGFKYNSKYSLYHLVIPFLLLLVSLALMPNNQFDFHLEDMIEKNHPQILAANTLNEQYTGSLPLEVSLLGGSGAFKQADHIARIDDLQQWLASRGIHDSFSLVTILVELQQAFKQKGLPDNDALVAQYLLFAELGNEDVIQQVLTKDYSMTRIRAFMPDMGSTAFKALQDDFNVYVSSLFSGTGITARLTGEMPLVYEGFDRLTYQILMSLLLAVFCIFLVMALIFKKPYLLLASIFPNILPILLGLAFYSHFDQGLSPLPAIAFCIGIGISVDDTIHLFSRYKHFLKQGFDANTAIAKAIESAAPAIILSSIVLCVGFLSFVLSGFTWNQELGLLVSFIIVCALMADLYITPACIHWLHVKRTKR